MNPKYPFQFSLLQYTHDAFTEEFLNVGFAFYAPNAPYFNVRLLTKYRRITNTFPTADGEYIKNYLVKLQGKFDNMIEQINNGQIAFEPHPATIDELLTMVLPIDDSSIKFGSIHGGMTYDLETTFEDFYRRFIETHLPVEKEESRDEAVIWRHFSSSLRKYNIIHQLRSAVIHTKKDDLEFDHAWKNGHWNALQPLSFDLMHPTSIKKKSHEWFTANVLITETDEVNKLFYLLGKPQREDSALKKAYNKAKDLLGTGTFSKKIEIIEEDGAEDFAEHIAPKIIKDTAHDSE